MGELIALHCGSKQQNKPTQDNLTPNTNGSIISTALQFNYTNNYYNILYHINGILIALHCGSTTQTTKQTNSKQRKKDSHFFYEKGAIDDTVLELHHFALHNDNCYLGDRMMFWLDLEWLALVIRSSSILSTHSLHQSESTSRGILNGAITWDWTIKKEA